MDENESSTRTLQQDADSVLNEAGKSPRFFKRFFREVWEFAKIILISLLIVLPVRLFVAQPFIVRGASMEPTFQNGQYLIVDELSYLLRDPARGEVIVFRYPADTSQFFIKRIIGLPGETVVIENGSVAIQNGDHPDGFVLDESYLPDTVSTAPNLRTTLNPGEYFVLGDNRWESSDSRRWGTLADEFLIGRTFVRLWPLADVGLVTND